MDLSAEGLHKAELAAQAKETPTLDGEATVTTKPAKKVWTKEKPTNGVQKPKKKKKKFRYESKGERKMTRMKEKSKNTRQAKARREQ